MAFLFWSFRIFPRPQYRLSPWHTSVIRDLVLVGLAEEKVALRAHLKPWKYEAPSWKVKGEDIIYIHRHAIYLLLYIFCYRYIIYDVYIYILHMYICFIYIGRHICFRYIVRGMWESDLCGKIYLDLQLRPWSGMADIWLAWLISDFPKVWEFQRLGGPWSDPYKRRSKRPL